MEHTLPRVRQGLLTTLMALCVVTVVGMVAAINLAVPLLSASPLHPSPTALLWVVDSYVVVFACLLIPAGAAADRFGRKGILLAGLGVFTAGALLSGCANDVTPVLAGRVLSGVGAAAVMPASLAILVGAVPAEQRTKAVATWASATGLGGVLGNIGGGALLQTGSWRALFFGVAPLALAVLVLCGLFVPRTPAHPRPIAVPSALLFTAGVVALLLGITSGPSTGWASTPVLGAFAAAAALLGAWCVVELRIAHPMLDPRLFAIPALRAHCLALVATFVGMFGLFYLNGQYLQHSKGFPPFLAGLALLPMAVTLFFGPRVTVALAGRVRPRLLTASGLVIVALGLAALSTADSATPYPWYASATVVLAAGTSLILPLSSAGIMAALPHERAGVGSGLQGMTRELGSALGVALAGTVLNTHADFTSGMHVALLVLAGVVALTGAVVVTTRVSGAGS
ncbi:MFS transporter [Amycolatopsis sp. cmx-8-4]|uniref:MFS transporter n=1 Tax=Amycolatopsis sp. cmx-8-4 TaxID=2790947 RepID=UPI00397ACBED